MNRLQRTLLALVAGALLATSVSVPPAAATGTTACDTTVVGGVVYYDAAGAQRILPNLQVQAWNTTNGQVGSGFTDHYGQFYFCFDSSRAKAIQIRYVTVGPRWGIRSNGGEYYSWTSGTLPVTPGVQLYFGYSSAPTATGNRLLRMFDQVNAAWSFVPKTGAACFDPVDTVCRYLDIFWDTVTPNGPYYNRDLNKLFIDQFDVDDPAAVERQLAYALMDDVFEDIWPQTPNCTPRDPARASSAGCAWVEGFADWLVAMFSQENLIYWPDGRIFDLESGGWHTDWDRGDTTELRVAAALFDLVDSTDPGYGGPWDRYGEGTANIWYTFTRHPGSANLSQFWANRAADGFNVADSGARAALYQNTIDYQFREPLANGSVLTRPTPILTHAYVASKSHWDCAVVGIRPSSNANYNLSVFQNRELIDGPLASSGASGSDVDFVAVTGRTETLYPTVYTASGSGSYDIQMRTAEPIEYLQGATRMVHMSSSDIVQGWTVYGWYQIGIKVTVTPTNADQKAAVFLLKSDYPEYGGGRGDAIASAQSNGAGGTMTVGDSPWDDSWYTIVLVNQAGAGDYQVTMSPL